MEIEMIKDLNLTARKTDEGKIELILNYADIEGVGSALIGVFDDVKIAKQWATDMRPELPFINNASS